MLSSAPAALNLDPLQLQREHQPAGGNVHSPSPAMKNEQIGVNPSTEAEVQQF